MFQCFTLNCDCVDLTSEADVAVVVVALSFKDKFNSKSFSSLSRLEVVLARNMTQQMDNSVRRESLLLRFYLSFLTRARTFCQIKKDLPLFLDDR